MNYQNRKETFGFEKIAEKPNAGKPYNEVSDRFY